MAGIAGALGDARAFMPRIPPPPAGAKQHNQLSDADVEQAHSDAEDDDDEIQSVRPQEILVSCQSALSVERL